MMRLIDADKLPIITKFDENDYIDVDDILNAPTIDDLVPVTHGHWIKHDIDKGILTLSECSVCTACVHICEKNCALAYENYCPHCGAKMDEIEE